MNWEDYARIYRDRKSCADIMSKAGDNNLFRDIREVSYRDAKEFLHNPQQAIFLNIWHNIYDNDNVGSNCSDAMTKIEIMHKESEPASHERKLLKQLISLLIGSVILFGEIPAGCSAYNNDGDTIPSYRLFSAKYDYLEVIHSNTSLASMALQSFENLRKAMRLFDDPVFDEERQEFKQTFLDLFNSIDRSKVLKQFEDLVVLCSKTLTR